MCIRAPCPDPKANCVPIADLSKTGTCPVFLLECTSEGGCGYDADCPSNDKCCQVDCGPRVCTQPAECPLRKCTADCTNGYERDDQGCRTCTCIPTPDPPTPKCEAVSCPTAKCAYGFANGPDGCQTCDCNPEPVECPIPRCQYQCPNGYATTAQGCQTCTCIPDSNPTIQCSRPLCNPEPNCPNGYEKDANGCNTCTCLPVPDPAGNGDSPNADPNDNQKSPSGVQKSGVCPADRVGRKFASDITCSDDGGCPGNKMCCSRAGAKVCRSPDVPKSGTCPVVTKNAKFGKSSVSKCDADSECVDNEKCCENSTGSFECTTPA